MKIKLELKVLHQIPLLPEVAAAILKNYIEEISAGGFILDETFQRKDLNLGVIYGGGIIISRIKEIDVREEKGYLFVDNYSEKRYYSLGAFTEISWQSEK